MEQRVINDIKIIIKGVIKAFNNYDANTIMELSNHIIHSASIYQDKLTSMTAIITYSLGKIIARGKVRRYPQKAWEEFKARIRNGLNKALTSANENDLNGLRKALLMIQQGVIKLDESFMSYAEVVITKGKMNKGAKMHEHGVSVKRIADLFGVSEWELMNYIGKTNIYERDITTSNVKERLKKARRLFN